MKKANFIVLFVLLFPLISFAMSHRESLPPPSDTTTKGNPLAAAAEISASDGYVDLMPSTDRKGSVLRVKITFTYSGPGTIFDIPIHFFFDESRIEKYPNSQTKQQEDRASKVLKKSETHDVNLTCLLTDIPRKTIVVSWKEPHTGEEQSTFITVKKVY